MKKILVFSGAGIDKESGVETFRDSKDGLWNNYNIEDVATLGAWRKNKQLVLDFYNERLRQLDKINPNLAHEIIVELENDFEVTVVTQNVTNLHERAGSTDVIHLHGELYRSKSTFPGNYDSYELEGEIKLGDKCPRGSQLRHNICFFGEELNPHLLSRAEEAARDADICIIIGTSMQVAPANMIPFLVKDTAIIYYVDPSDDFKIPNNKRDNFIHIKEVATLGMKEVFNDLKEIYL